MSLTPVGRDGILASCSGLADYASLSRPRSAIAPRGLVETINLRRPLASRQSWIRQEPLNRIAIKNDAPALLAERGNRPVKDRGRSFRILSSFPLPQAREPTDDGWRAVASAVRTWHDLSKDWDGNGALPPAGQALRSAACFVETAVAHDAPCGEPFITGDGELGFHWSGETEIATLFFLADGDLYAFVPRRGPSFSFSGQLDDAAIFPAFLRALRDLV